MILWFIALIAVTVIFGGIIFLQTYLHYKEKEELFNRFMAGDYRAYQYYEKEYPAVIDEEKKKAEIERKREKTETEKQDEKAAEDF